LTKKKPAIILLFLENDFHNRPTGKVLDWFGDRKFTPRFGAVMKIAQASQELLDTLNEILSMEYGATIQYAQHHFLLSGPERINFSNFFDLNSKEAHLHALNLGNKIVALGGVPTTESAPVYQASTLSEMLVQDLEMERGALAAYIRAWELAEGNQILRFWLEDIIRLEQLHVEELEKMTAAQQR
jgi:bacterioferritin (cytochrome b1)